jgi:hypothetical protein
MIEIIEKLCTIPGIVIGLNHLAFCHYPVDIKRKQLSRILKIERERERERERESCMASPNIKMPNISVNFSKDGNDESHHGWIKIVDTCC